MAQGVYPQRAALAKQLAIPEQRIRYINKWNGGTFGGAISAAPKFYPWLATISKETKRPVKMVLPKDQELTALSIKAQNLTSFKVGATKEGKIIACHREFHVNTGANGGNPASAESAANSAGGGGRSELYLHVFPNWKEEGYLYRTNSLLVGASRSNSQQEFKWCWEQMMDEMAEACGIDPVKVRLGQSATARDEGRSDPGRSDGPHDGRDGKWHADIRLLCGQGSRRRREKSHRMGPAESSSWREPGKVQARDRNGHVPAPCGTCWLSGR